MSKLKRGYINKKNSIILKLVELFPLISMLGSIITVFVYCLIGLG